MALFPTPHIGCRPEDFGKTVLMPGDPLRSQFIAERFLDNPRLVNDVRGVHGYTGNYKGVKVSVMASGMGMPSMGIYSYELFHFFGVENIIRVGSCGGLADSVKVRDLILGLGASTNSAYCDQFMTGGHVAPTADYKLLKTAEERAGALHVPVTVGNFLSSDVFYSDDDGKSNDKWKKMGCLAVEMEAAALYINAMRTGKRALAICTVSDHIYTGESLTPQERQTTFTDMMKVALETAVEAEKF